MADSPSASYHKQLNQKCFLDHRFMRSHIGSHSKPGFAEFDVYRLSLLLIGCGASGIRPRPSTSELDLSLCASR